MNKIIKNPFLWAFIFGVIFLHFIKYINESRLSAPEPLIYVNDWQLLNHKGEIVRKADFKGKVLIASFFFTSCPSICPILTENMKELYERLKDKSNKIVFLSITVDPETDTKEVLSEYMKKNNLNNLDNWQALTGTKKDIYEVVVKNMHIHIGEKENIANNSYDIPHLAKLALFDKNGDLRGLFSTTKEEISFLASAARLLMR